MKSEMLKKAIYVILLTEMNLFVIGFPVTNFETNLVNKDEKHYPNGTVIGKYTYKDVEGNPIHVKYYADDASYGVELKSMKVINSNSDLSETQSKLPLLMMGDSFELTLEPLLLEDQTLFNKIESDPSQLHKNIGKETHNNDKADYEIFSQNELKAPEKCGKEKVKVYFDKDKRKTRNSNNYESAEYCDRF